MKDNLIQLILSTGLLFTLTACGESLPLAEVLVQSEGSTVDLQNIVDSFTALSHEDQQTMAETSGTPELQTLMRSVQELEPQARQTRVYQQLNQKPEMVSTLQQSSLAGYQPPERVSLTAEKNQGAYVALIQQRLQPNRYAFNPFNDSKNKQNYPQNRNKRLHW